MQSCLIMYHYRFLSLTVLRVEISHSWVQKTTITWCRPSSTSHKKTIYSLGVPPAYIHGAEGAPPSDQLLHCYFVLTGVLASLLMSCKYSSVPADYKFLAAWSSTHQYNDAVDLELFVA